MANNIKFNVKINNSKCNEIQKKAEKALFLTAEALHTEVVQAQVMPFDTGNLQNDSTFVDDSQRDKVSIVSSTPYARRLYFHPEYNFRHNNNYSVGGHWFDEFLNGEFIANAYGELLKRKGGL